MKKILSEQREVIRMIERTIDNVKKMGQANFTASNLRNRQTLMKERWERCQQLHSSLLNAVSEDEREMLPYFKNDEFQQAEDTFLEAMEFFDEQLIGLVKPESNFNPNSHSSVASESSSVAIPLPRIQLPKFSGQYTEWANFRDLFTSLVASNETLSDVQRLHYLKSSVTGEASLVLRNIPVTNVNYRTAWSELQQRYENKRMIVSVILKNILDLSPMKSESAAELKRVFETVSDSINALKNLSRTVDDDFVTAIVERKLDVHTLQEWNFHLGGSVEPPAYSELSQFLMNRLRALEATQQVKEVSNKSNKVGVTKSLVSSVNKSKCLLCNESHPLYHCSNFKTLTVGKRKEFAKTQRCCYNCLGKGHFPRSCLSNRRCNLCHGKHHTLLHEGGENNDQKEKVTPSKENELPGTSVSDSGSRLALKAQIKRLSPSYPSVLLATAKIRVRSSDGREIRLRALIDSGSEATLISERAVQSLRLRRQKTKIKITGIGDKCSGVANFTVRILLGSCEGKSEFIKARAIVLPALTSYSRTPNFKHSAFSHLQGLTFADGDSSTHDRVDLIVGADLYGSILLEGLRRGSASEPIAQNTIFGWIVFGPCKQCPSGQSDSSINQSRATCLYSFTSETMESDLRKFWELEEVPESLSLTEEEERCEKHFASSHCRRSDGRYVVRLPFKQNTVTDFVNSFQIASRSLERLENRLSKDVKLEEAYSQFLREYERMGHMAPVSDTENCESPVYYMPHHPVLRETSTTSPLRVVFNASCVTSSGFSLNDLLLTGPKLQSDLPSILLRWRTHRFVFIADIAKMFRQIFVHPADTNYQRILWRSDDHKTTAYRLLTVTYGTACAPFLAMRILKQLCLDEGTALPLAVAVLENSTYVDDVLFGAHEVSAIFEIRNQLNTLLKLGGFHLRKWTSNHEELLRDIPASDRLNNSDVSFQEEIPIKALGLSWNPRHDCFSFQITLEESTKVTKRYVLSIISRIFDPLGLISPVVVSAKILLQELWIRKLDWDAPLPSDLSDSWKEYVRSLRYLREISIPRWTEQLPETIGVELHGFADASSKAYAAVVYIRVLTSMDRIKVCLLMSKTKVAPIKTVSIPRLELCAAVLLSKLMEFIQKVLDLSSVPTYCWSDSTITLAWIKKHPSSWKQFVANRVSDIQNRLPNAQWRYISTKFNPADSASRGVGAEDLRKHPLWWSGPPWLCKPSACWPDLSADDSIDIDVERRPTRILVTQIDFDLWSLHEEVSSWPRLLRITAYCLIFCSKVSRYKLFADVFKGDSESYLRNAIELSRNYWLRSVQQSQFSEEIKTIKNNKFVTRSSKLKNLNPFLDGEGLLRVGGRLDNSAFPFEEQHPVILPKHRISSLIAEQTHQRCLHGGSQLTLRVLRQAYWVLNARSLVKQVVHNCIVCTRYRAASVNQQMGDLPKARVNPARPFTHTGVDYAGPFHVLPTAKRGQKAMKAYICLFVCLTTRAIHLELVTDYSTQGFLAAFKRFSARRGLPAELYSDNGTNFQGADRELTRAFKALSKDVDLQSHLATDGLTWRFIPPSAPHFGGIWEAGVKSVKHHLRRIVGSHTLSLEEFNTLLMQIESCLNSRPLSSLSDDPSDLTSLTPGHFLIGKPLNSVPEESVLDLAESRLDRWQRVRRMFEGFWKVWSTDYLNSLQQRLKWQQRCDNLRLGELVIVRNELLPPNKWELGRVTSVYPDAKGYVRVVDVKTISGNYKRPIVRLCRLPLSISLPCSKDQPHGGRLP